MRKARFALDELLTPQRSGPLIDRQLQPGRPAILSIQPFPLLLAQMFEPKRAWLVRNQGALSLTRDGRLLHWINSRRGGGQIAADLPIGNLHWAATEADREGRVRAVVGRLSQRGLQLLQIDLRNRTCAARLLALAGGVPRSVTEYQGVLYVIFDNHVEAFDATSAESCGWLPTINRQWVRGRFFRSLRPPNHDWVALAFEDTSPKLEPLPASLLQDGQVLTVFDCPGADGPLSVTNRGVISPYAADGRPFRVFDSPVMNAAFAVVSRNGARLALQVKGSVKNVGGWLIDVAERRCTAFSGSPHDAVEADLRRLMHPRAMRHDFHAIAALSDGSLALSGGKRRRWWRLSLGNTSNSLYLRHVPMAPPTPAVRCFDRILPTPEVGFSLRTATWSDGSMACLDSRDCFICAARTWRSRRPQSCSPRGRWPVGWPMGGIRAPIIFCPITTLA